MEFFNFTQATAASPSGSVQAQSFVVSGTFTGDEIAAAPGDDLYAFVMPGELDPSSVKDITLSADAINDKNGSVSVNLTDGNGGSCTTPFPKPPSLVNALFDIDGLGLKAGTKISSLTGVVGFFCNLQLAPRTPADIVVAK